MTDTSWSKSAQWYDELLGQAGTYQKELILPNLLRLMNLKKGERVLDLACGQGFFAREFFKTGANVIATDISKELISLAQKNSPKNIEFHVAPAHDLKFITSQSIDKTVIVLALQNIENTKEVLQECARVLKSGALLFVVMNHPAFRIPKASAWGWDEDEKVQFRRIDEYLSESKVKIQMHPGDKPSEHTVSFHRPLQFYFKMLTKADFAVTGLEEWNSHRRSQAGPRAKAEDKARKEIPLFLCLVAQRGQ